MKVEQAPAKFQPITITIESEQDYIELIDALQDIVSVKAQFSYTNTVRTLLNSLKSLQEQ
jgi:hypothetical protein